MSIFVFSIPSFLLHDLMPVYLQIIRTQCLTITMGLTIIKIEFKSFLFGIGLLVFIYIERLRIGYQKKVLLSEKVDTWRLF